MQTGSNFDGTATVLWGGTPLATHLTSATQLQALVPANLLAEEGNASVAVTEDGGTSGGLPFTLPDAPLSGLSVRNLSATKGTGFTDTIVTFTDANPAAPPPTARLPSPGGMAAAPPLAPSPWAAATSQWSPTTPTSASRQLAEPRGSAAAGRGPVTR